MVSDTLLNELFKIKYLGDRLLYQYLRISLDLLLSEERNGKGREE